MFKDHVIKFSEVGKRLGEKWQIPSFMGSAKMIAFSDYDPICSQKWLDDGRKEKPKRNCLCAISLINGKQEYLHCNENTITSIYSSSRFILVLTKNSKMIEWQSNAAKYNTSMEYIRKFRKRVFSTPSVIKSVMFEHGGNRFVAFAKNVVYLYTRKKGNYEVIFKLKNDHMSNYLGFCKVGISAKIFLAHCKNGKTFEIRVISKPKLLRGRETILVLENVHSLGVCSEIPGRDDDDVVMASKKKELFLYSLGSKKIIEKIGVHKENIISVVCMVGSENSTLFAVSLSKDKIIIVWNVKKKEIVQLIDLDVKEKSELTSLKVDLNCKHLNFYTSSNERICQWMSEKKMLNLHDFEYERAIQKKKTSTMSKSSPMGKRKLKRRTSRSDKFYYDQEKIDEKQTMKWLPLNEEEKKEKKVENVMKWLPLKKSDSNNDSKNKEKKVEHKMKWLPLKKSDSINDSKDKEKKEHKMRWLPLKSTDKVDEKKKEKVEKKKKLKKSVKVGGKNGKSDHVKVDKTIVEKKVIEKKVEKKEVVEDEKESLEEKKKKKKKQGTKEMRKKLIKKLKDYSLNSSNLKLPDLSQSSKEIKQFEKELQSYDMSKRDKEYLKKMKELNEKTIKMNKLKIQYEEIKQKKLRKTPIPMISLGKKLVKMLDIILECEYHLERKETHKINQEMINNLTKVVSNLYDEIEEIKEVDPFLTEVLDFGNNMLFNLNNIKEMYEKFLNITQRWFPWLKITKKK